MTLTVPGITVTTTGGSSSSAAGGSSGTSSSSGGTSSGAGLNTFTTSSNGTTTPALATSTTRSGVTLSYSIDSNFGQVLSNVSGQFVPGANIVFPNITPGSTNPQPGVAPAPPGVIISINQVNGPGRGNQLLGHAEVFGYDPTVNIRFDTATGAQTLTIPHVLPAANARVAFPRQRFRRV